MIPNIFTKKALELLKTREEELPVGRKDDDEVVVVKPSSGDKAISSNESSPLFVFKGGQRKGQKKRTLEEQEKEERGQPLVRTNYVLFDGETLTRFPYILMAYLQLVFNLCLIAIILYIIVQFVVTVQRDVEIKVEEHLTGE